MVREIDNPLRLSKKIINEIGNSISNSKEGIIRETGSCLYNLREIKFRSEQLNINENARCNFELFENGVLLRINDNQRYYVLPLYFNSNFEIEIFQGRKMVVLSRIATILSLFGVDNDFLGKYWIFRRGYSYERFKMKIKTEDELLLLDSSGRNFKGAMEYFSKSVIGERITTHNNAYKSCGE